ncbi:MAG: hypothetical protein ABI884_10190, partial [Gemmatimonadota bacterium]
MERYFADPRDASSEFREVPYFAMPWATSLEQVETFATEINNRLDDLISASSQALPVEETGENRGYARSS